MNSFNSTRNKLKNFDYQQQTNQNNILNLKRLSIKINPINLTKKIVLINILENYPITFSTESLES